MAYKVLDIYKELPRTNCGDCGRGSCFAFASAVFLEGESLELCLHLTPDQLAEMRRKLDEGRAAGEGMRAPSNEQALRALLAQLGEADVAALATKSGGEMVMELEGSSSRASRAVNLDFLDGSYVVSPEGVVAVHGGDPPVSVKILLLIYLTRATGSPPSGSWIAYRDLPNTVSKSKSFEAAAHKIAKRFAASPTDLEAAVRRLDGERFEAESADVAFIIRALPRVSLMLLFWSAEEEFEARVSLLVDRTVLDYLDQEAIVFLAEALAARLAGEDLSELVA